MSIMPKQKIVWVGLFLFVSFLLATFTVEATHAAYRMVNNQTIKRVDYLANTNYIEDPQSIRYFFVNKPQAVGGSGGSVSVSTNDDLNFVGISESDNNPTICKQWIAKTHSTVDQFQLYTLPRTNGACSVQPNAPEDIQVANAAAGEATFLFKKDNETIQTAIQTASDSEFKKVRNTNGLGLENGHEIYIQTRPSVECPRLLVKYGGNNWGFVAPVMKTTYQDDAGSKYYLRILEKYGTDISNLGACSARDAHEIRENNIAKFADITSTTKSFWDANDEGYMSFYDIKGAVMKLPSPMVGDASAADIKLGTAPENSFSSGATTPGESGEDNSTSCGIDGIGWIICPVLNFMASLSDGAYNFLANNFLQTPTALLQMNDDNQAWNAWRSILSIANVLFVIGFLVIVFSQLTSMGVSNYGVKKMLPRLIMGAILINLSFFICAIAIDLSNILGHGVKEFLTNITTQGGGSTNSIQDGGGFAGMVGSVIMIGGAGAIFMAASGGFWMALVALAGILAAALIALVMIFFILQIRQVLIVVLLVLSPIAFAAYLLPNTEHLFKKWKKVFIAMLMLYPIIGLVYGASALASDVIVGIYTSGADIDGSGKIMGQIVGAGVMILPLFVVPGILKKALDSIDGIGGKLSAFGSKIGGKAKGGIKGSEFAKYRGGLAAQRAAKIRAGKYTGRSPFGKAQSGINRRLNKKDGVFDKATGGYGAKRGRAYDAWRGKEIKDMADGMAGYTYPDSHKDAGMPIDPEEIYRDKLAEFHGSRGKSEAERSKAEIGLAAAQLHLARTNGNAGSEYAKAAMDHYRSTGRVPSHADIQAGMRGGGGGRAAFAGGAAGGGAGASAGGGGASTGGGSGGSAAGGGSSSGGFSGSGRRVFTGDPQPSPTALKRAQEMAGTMSGTGGESRTNQSGGPTDAGSSQYRQNAAGKDIRPEGSVGKGGSGAFLSKNEKQQIDAHESALQASQKAYDDAIAGGLTREEAQAIGGNVFQVHAKSDGGASASASSSSADGGLDINGRAPRTPNSDAGD